MMQMENTMSPKATTYASREDWLRARKDGIGASEVAGLLGFSRWTTPYAIWASKVTSEINVDGPMLDRQYWGLALEDKIAEAFEKATGFQTSLPVSWYEDLTATHLILWHAGVIDGRAIPLFATPDRYVIVPGCDCVALLELKTAGAERAADWADGPPLEYLIQVQAQLACHPRAPWAYIAVLIGGNDFRWYKIERAPATIEAIERAVASLWWDHIASEIPPAVDGHPATTEAIKRRYPKDVPDSEIDLDAEAEDAGRRLLDLGDAIEAVKEKLASLKMEASKHENVLRQAIGDATYGWGDGVLWSLKTTNRKGVLRIEPEHAETLESHAIPYKVTEASSYRTLRHKVIKGDAT
jgi:putative phage-type endonuclease